MFKMDIEKKHIVHFQNLATFRINSNSPSAENSTKISYISTVYCMINHEKSSFSRHFTMITDGKNGIISLCKTLYFCSVLSTEVRLS